MNKDQLEQINLRNAYQYMMEQLRQKKALTESCILKMHTYLSEGIMHGGIYRKIPVYISGASHDIPLPEELPRKMKEYYEQLNMYQGIRGMPGAMDTIELAAWSHAEFVAIHPFQDGNGRMSRLILNYELISGGCIPIIIPVEDKMKYYKLLDQYACQRDIKPLSMYVDFLEDRAVTSMNVKTYEAMSSKEQTYIPLS